MSSPPPGADALMTDHARDVVSHMLLKRPDLGEYMVGNGQRVGVMAIDEMTTDIPEQGDWKKPAFDDRRLTDGGRERHCEPGASPP